MPASAACGARADSYLPALQLQTCAMCCCPRYPAQPLHPRCSGWHQSRLIRYRADRTGEAAGPGSGQARPEAKAHTFSRRCCCVTVVRAWHVGSAGSCAVDPFPPAETGTATARNTRILALSVQLASLIARAGRRGWWRRTWWRRRWARERVLLIAVASGGMRRHSACTLNSLDMWRYWAPQTSLIRSGVPVYRSALGILDARGQALRF